MKATPNSKVTSNERIYCSHWVIDSVPRMKMGLGILVLVILGGCSGGYVEASSGSYYGGPVVVEEPDTYVFGGYYGGWHDEYGYSHRGYESRGGGYHSGGRH